MRLVLIRHADAEDAPQDAARRLTEKGRRIMRRAARGLREILPQIDRLATSPLARARETADIVARAFELRDRLELAAAAPGGDRGALLAWLREQPPDATAAIVGHEPDLSTFASWLISSDERTGLVFKKGACCLIEFDRAPTPGTARLAWLLQPALLRKLG